MEEDDELSQAIRRIHRVEQHDAAVIWKEFFPRLMRLARAKLESMPKRTFDEEDIGQSAMISFFKGVENGRFREIQHSEDLWRLLVTITCRKITAKRRMQFASKRGGGAVRGHSVFANDGSDEIDGFAAVLDPNQMPESADEIAKNCQDLLDLLPDEVYRKTALRRMEGFSNQEISDELKCSVARTKQRLARIREIWSSD